jgi:drug/metabolite transporter (DMT)-like permease
MTRATLALVAAAFLFGSTFLVVKDAVEDAAVVPFLATRFLVGAAVLGFVARHRARTSPARPRRRGLVRGGVTAGAALAGGYLFQTAGLQYVSSTVSAFVTYLLVVFVPVLSAVVLRRSPRPTGRAGPAHRWPPVVRGR